MNVKHMQGPLKKFRDALLHSENLLVAISGGKDSMVLCDLLLKCKIQFQIAHVNYGLRGDESDGDENFVRSFAEKNHLKIHVLNVNTAEECKINNKGIQEFARAVRYKWFEQLRLEFNLKFIMTAHHKDDQVETILHQFIRGGGLAALRGMKEIQGNIYRPLLSFSKKEILDYANENKLEWREDSSNETINYTRNFIRHELIPVMEKINANLKDSITSRADIFEEAENYLNQKLAEEISNEVSIYEDGIQFKVSWIRTHTASKTLIWRLLQPYNFNAAQSGEALKLVDAESGKSISSSSHYLLRDRAYFMITPIKLNETHFEILIASAPFEIDFPIAMLGEMYDFPTHFSKDKNIAQLDTDKITWPLVLRNWHEGDRFVPLGMKGHQKVSDFLILQKVPLHEKKKILVLVSDNKVVWIVKYRISDEFKLDANSKKMLSLKV